MGRRREAGRKVAGMKTQDPWYTELQKALMHREHVDAKWTQDDWYQRSDVEIKKVKNKQMRVYIHIYIRV